MIIIDQDKGIKIEAVDEKDKFKKKREVAKTKATREVPLKKDEGVSSNLNNVSELEKKLAELEAENARLRDLIPVETETRKLSVTLPVSLWNEIDKHLKKEKLKQASFFAELAKKHFRK